MPGPDGPGKGYVPLLALLRDGAVEADARASFKLPKVAAEVAA